jgi:hypothetical protein
MVVRNPLVLISGVTAELPVGDTVSGGTGPAAPALVLLTTEIDLGSTPTTSGTFTIAGTGMTVGKSVRIFQSVGPYTGKGTMSDEAEMDALSVVASVTSPTIITAFWRCATRVSGNFKFDYFVGG